VPRSEGFTSRVVREGRVIVINDARDHPLFATPEAREWNLEAIAGFPLKRAGRVVGVFTLAFLEPHTFTEDELRVLDLLADQAVVAIENARLVKGLEAEVASRTAEILAEKETSEAILNSVGDAIMMSGPDMRIRYVNPAFTALTGYSLDEIRGQDANRFGAGVGSVHEVGSIAETLEKGQVWRGDVTVQRKDGRTYDAALTVAPVQDAEGKRLGYVSSHRDISRIKELDRARNRFITNVSHQLRTPVTNLKLYARLLRIGRHSEKASHYLQVVEAQAERLSHLVQDILELTTLDSGQAILDWEPINLADLLGAGEAGYRERAASAGIALLVAPPTAAPPPVMGDPERLAQALDELMENALLFTPTGGRVEVTAGTVAQEGRTWVALTVGDSGPGIPPAEQPRIFERFFRGGLADAGDLHGTGLGLSIVDEIMRAHGGRVTVESAPGGGSRFTLWLPAVDN
jgi:two-component system phosphate regulon sensor histidine kinase PhoR